jgi:hypothetical protein
MLDQSTGANVYNTSGWIGDNRESSIRKVKTATRNERASIGDFDNHAFVVGGVCHADH